MISKSKINYIKSLRTKKARIEESSYIIEGDKLIKEYIMSGKVIRLLVAKSGFIESLTDEQRALIDDIETVNERGLERISSLSTPHNALAVVPITTVKTDPGTILEKLCAAIDCIQDPGNLGTIIRSAAWFGITDIICSPDSVDSYNPKVIQSAMGALMHVNVHYCRLETFLGEAVRKNVPVYGALLEGKPVYSMKLRNTGVILLGNESRGISNELLEFVTEKMAIPRFVSFRYGINSLNVSMAATVIFSEFARRRGSRQ
ncbi:MAG: RNA methyltransferase [Bacteroidales bacterium]|nr:RNA methyltransferase [Bacteroidales bacterium]HPM18750.1 RNA methyltransferase [Bacteroidales bacterium]HQG76801.1 RNA methyltransferase [Bacteroidales bacterium]